MLTVRVMHPASEEQTSLRSTEHMSTLTWMYNDVVGRPLAWSSLPWYGEYFDNVSWSASASKCDQPSSLRRCGMRVGRPLVSTEGWEVTVCVSKEALIAGGRLESLPEAWFLKCVPKVMILTSTWRRPYSQWQISITANQATGLDLWADHSVWALDRHRDICVC